MKINKLILSLVFSIFFISIPFNANILAASNVLIMIDGQKTLLEQSPVIENGRTLVPLRGVFERLEAEVRWIDIEKKVVVYKDNTKIELKVGDKSAVKNNISVPLDQEALIINGRTMVPLRFVSQALGTSVNYNNDTKLISITTPVDEVTNIVEDANKSNTEDKVNADEQFMTYDQAKELALKSSVKLKGADASVERAEEVRDKAADNVDYIPIVPATDALAHKAFTGLAQANIGVQSAKKQLELAQESIEYSVRKAYNEVLQAEEKVKVAKLSVESAESKNKIANDKYKVGVVGDFALTESENNLIAEKEKLQAAEKALEDSYQKFNLLVGLPLNEKNKLKNDIEYKEMDLEDLDRHVSNILSDSTSIWLVEQKVNIAKLNLEHYSFNDPTNIDTYKAKEIDVDKAKYDVASTKQQLEKATRSLYYSINQLQNQYNALKANLNKALEGQKLVKTQYEVGMAVSSDLLQANLTVEQLKQQMFDVTAQLDYLKIAYEKPWVAAEN